MGHAYDAYTRTAYAASARVIRDYSTSFSLAASLLERLDRQRIRALYALVRIADEVVDGAHPGTATQRCEQLRELEARVDDAMESGFSTDLVVHAFAHTARACGLTRAHWAPFFTSMRSDAQAGVGPAGCSGQGPRPETAGVPPVALSLDDYIYGSAEVVGDMCARIFFRGQLPPERSEQILAGARALGNAFQRINFVRDFGHDSTHLGRTYLPTPVNAEIFAAEIRLIRQQLTIARPALEHLPTRARMAVRVAHDLFADLTDRLEAVPVEQLATTRVSVPAAHKARIVARVSAEFGRSRLRNSSLRTTGGGRSD